MTEFHKDKSCGKLRVVYPEGFPRVSNNIKTGQVEMESWGTIPSISFGCVNAC